MDGLKAIEELCWLCSHIGCLNWAMFFYVYVPDQHMVGYCLNHNPNELTKSSASYVVKISPDEALIFAIMNA